MPIYKIDLIFQTQGYGWRETYYRDSATSIAGGLPTWTTLAQKRIPLSGFPVDLEAISVSDPLTPGRLGETFYLNPVLRPPYNPAVDLNDEGAAALTTSINVAFIQTSTNKLRRIWMRGVRDDAVVGGNALAGPGYANWLQLWGQYREYIIQSGYGWLSRPIAKEGFVSYAFPADTQVPEFTFPADFFALDQVNTYQLVRFSKFNGSKSVLNREMTVFVTARNKARATSAIAAGPDLTGGKAILYGTPVFIAANNLKVERVGRRAPGRPLLRTPGRGRARART